MKVLLSNKWFQISVTGIIAAVVFTMIGMSIGSGDSEASLQSGSQVASVSFVTGMTVESIGELNQLGGLGSSTQVALPITATEAVEAGWNDPVLCSVGRGRYFQKGSADEVEPYILMFNSLDDLIGVYLFNETEMPAPWQYTKEIKGVGRNKVVDFEHWGLFVYFQDPTRACKTTEAAQGTGNVFGGQASQERTTPTAAIPPTPTPATGEFLNLVVDRMKQETPLEFTLTGESGGVLGGDIHKAEGAVDQLGAVTLTLSGADGTNLDIDSGVLLFSFENLKGILGEMAQAIVDPVETKEQWIDNRPKQGVSGTLTGSDLKVLIPTAVADSNITVLLWADPEGRIRRIRIEGAVVSGDPPEAVRILNVSGYDD